MNSQIDELRKFSAKIIEGEVCKYSEDNIISNFSVKKFIQEELDLKLFHSDGREYIDFAQYNKKQEPISYGLNAASDKITAICQLKTPFPESPNNNTGTSLFNDAIIEYLKNTSNEKFNDLDQNFFRKKFLSKGRSDFSSSYNLTNDTEVPQFLAARLLDLAGRKKEVEINLIDSRHTQGLFFLAATEGTIGTLLGNSLKITFSDLLPNDWLFEETRMVIPSSGIMRDDPENTNINNPEDNSENQNYDFVTFEIERLKIKGKPTLTNKEISQFILRRYNTDWSSDPSRDNEISDQIQVNSIEVLRKIVRMTCFLFQSHMDQLSQLFRHSLLSGDLGRTVFDVEHGGVFVNQTDEGRFWTLAVSPIQGRIHSADSLIRDDIIKYFDTKLSERRGADRH